MSLSSPDRSGTGASQSENVAEEEVSSSFHKHIRDFFRKFHSSLVALLRNEFGEGPPSPEDVANQTFMKLLERGNVDDVRDLEAFSWIMAMNIVRPRARLRCEGGIWDRGSHASADAGTTPENLHRLSF